MGRAAMTAAAIVTMAVSVGEGQSARPAPAPIDALAAAIAGEAGTPGQKTARLVSWINREFTWTATDYEQRTAEEIITRRGGNCAELARVLARLLDSLHVRYRWVREINVQPASDSRQANAEARIATGGLRFSVFGRRHNDHAWLEVLDPDSGAWHPADPAVGVVGMDDWIAARLAFDSRRQPAVEATVPIVRAMLAPVAVVAGREDRTSEYLIDGFDRAYGDRLRTLPEWPRWTAIVRALGPLAGRAFAGDVNLHEHAAEIEQAGAAYEALRSQAARAGLKPARALPSALGTAASPKT